MCAHGDLGTFDGAKYDDVLVQITFIPASQSTLKDARAPFASFAPICMVCVCTCVFTCSM